MIAPFSLVECFSVDRFGNVITTKCVDLRYPSASLPY